MLLRVLFHLGLDAFTEHGSLQHNSSTVTSSLQLWYANTCRSTILTDCVALIDCISLDPFITGPVCMVIVELILVHREQLFFATFHVLLRF